MHTTILTNPPSLFLKKLMPFVEQIYGVSSLVPVKKLKLEFGCSAAIKSLSVLHHSTVFILFLIY